MKIGDLLGKRIAILVENDYEDLELWYPILRLREAGHEPIVVGTGSSDVYRSKHGYEIKPDIQISEAEPQKFDGVIVPGGWAPDKLRRYPQINGFVREIFEAGKLVAAICHGGSVLISAGILKGKKVTGVIAIKDDLINAGARFKDEEVVTDGNLVTSRKPSDLPAFMREILKILGN
ncbi:MAG: type 1 glutamine amidotransferase domain-containing protein [Methanomassiliicoccales archaeon]|jgi:protease I|nr:type 1 glutamine amidotransferase domain-containing protein [Methanomassiliicoccales archaeon]